MRRHGAVLVGVLFLVPSIGQAQGTAIELGTGIGASILSAGGTLTLIGAPGAGVRGQAPLYVSFILPSGFMIQPETSFNIVTGGGETLTTISVATNAGFLFSRAATNSAYAAMSGALQFASFSGSSDSEFAVGARLGYRMLVNPGFAVSIEGGYRRWLDSDLNEITIALRLGGILSAGR